MFFIFGWNNVKQKDLGNLMPINCSNCNNLSYFHLVKVSKWFDLFFIPIFPYETKYYALCSVCGWGVEIEKNLDKAEELVGITDRFLDKKITETSYKKELDKYTLILFQQKEEELEEVIINEKKEKTKKTKKKKINVWWNNFKKDLKSIKIKN